MRALVFALAACASAANAQERSNWERDNVVPQVEESDALPAFPQAKSLIEFEVAEMRGYRFFVDAASLSVSRDGVVRYVLVAKSDSGAQNISYEGMRCETKQYRRYAMGRADGTWARVEENWRVIPAAGQRWYRALQRDYFCPQTQPIRSAEEGIRALQDGGNAWAKGLGSPGSGSGR